MYDAVNLAETLCVTEWVTAIKIVCGVMSNSMNISFAWNLKAVEFVCGV